MMQSKPTPSPIDRPDTSKELEKSADNVVHGLDPVDTDQAACSKPLTDTTCSPDDPPSVHSCKNTGDAHQRQQAAICLSSPSPHTVMSDLSPHNSPSSHVDYTKDKTLAAQTTTGTKRHIDVVVLDSESDENMSQVITTVASPGGDPLATTAKVSAGSDAKRTRVELGGEQPPPQLKMKSITSFFQKKVSQ